jgi:hypothetical protein
MNAANSALTFGNSTGGTPYFTLTANGPQINAGVLRQGLGAAIASAATIAPATSVVHITGTVTITTITPPLNCTTASTACVLTFIPDAAVPFSSTGGNILNSLTATTNVPVLAVYDASLGRWLLK